MKHLSHRHAFLAIAVFAGAVASAHAQTPPAPNTPPTPPGARNVTVYTGEPLYFNVAGNDSSLQKKIKLDIKGKNAADVFKKIAQEADADLDVDSGILSDRKYTIQADGFTVQSALNGIANFEGVRWQYQDINGKKKIRIVRNPVARVVSRSSTESTIYDQQIRDAVRNRLDLAQRAIEGVGEMTLFSSARLPDTRVKIDVRDADVRDVLKDILTQANLPYALEDDVPTGQKRSFTFENVPVSMALDIITTSIGVGWRADTQRTTTKTGSGNVPAAPLVRVGKKYTGRGQTFRSLTPATSINFTTTTTTSSDQPAPAAPTPPATP